MASEQWLLNDTSVADNAYFTAVGSSYKLKNTTGGTVSRVTSSPSPIEGAGCYASDPNNARFIFQTSASVDLNGAIYTDAYVYFSSAITGNVNAIFAAGDDTDVQYTWANVKANGAMEIASYDVFFGARAWGTTSPSVVPNNEWVRFQVSVNDYGVNVFRFFKGLNLNGSTPDTTVTKDFNGLFSAYYFLVVGQSNNGDANKFYFDSIKVDTAAYPTRLQIGATGTATATGTAAMSNARTLQATATGTATGTAAASNQRTLAASASATASGTAAMSSTQAMSASGSVTASGTAAANVTSVVTVDASASVTASGTAAMASTQAMSASATITATGLADGSIRPIVTVDGAGTITATGTTTFNKSQALAASASATASATASLIAITTIAATASVTATATATLLITTPGSLYGNATKVAGLYGSSTKPTLTTRS